MGRRARPGCARRRVRHRRAPHRRALGPRGVPGVRARLRGAGPAWSGLAGLLAYGLGWVAVVQVLSLAGPGGTSWYRAGS